MYSVVVLLLLPCVYLSTPLFRLLLLLLLLLLAAAVRHCIPAARGVLHTAAAIAVNFFISNEHAVLRYTPWLYGCFCAASVHPITVPLFATLGLREGAQPAATKPRL